MEWELATYPPHYSRTRQELAAAIAQETAKMSYPGGMSRGDKQVVTAGTKAKIESHFLAEFPKWGLMENASGIAEHFHIWHQEQAETLAAYLEREHCLGNPANDKVTVAAKFLDTFLHQLMKYEWARPLWKHLHLPLDPRVLQAIWQATTPAAEEIKACVGDRSAYAITYADYMHIQLLLWDLLQELNHRPCKEFDLTSRIELNYLWL